MVERAQLNVTPTRRVPVGIQLVEVILLAHGESYYAGLRPQYLRIKTGWPNNLMIAELSWLWLRSSNRNTLNPQWSTHSLWNPDSTKDPQGTIIGWLGCHCPSITRQVNEEMHWVRVISVKIRHSANLERIAETLGILHRKDGALPSFMCIVGYGTWETGKGLRNGKRSKR
jgi:hypothetical protein